MNLYLIDRIESGYDEHHTMVVAADTAIDARLLASEVQTGDQDNTDWLRPDKSTARAIGIATADVERGIVFADYH